jgi:hypothetical protein
MGDGGGGSQTYTFDKNGKYQMFNYVKTRMYGWQMEALTWENGTATFSGDKVTLRPTSGKYKGIDNRVGKNNFTRPMRADELKKNVKTYTWSLDTDNGKPVLQMGKDPGSMSSYKRPE